MPSRTEVEQVLWELTAGRKDVQDLRDALLAIIPPAATKRRPDAALVRNLAALEALPTSIEALSVLEAEPEVFAALGRLPKLRLLQVRRGEALRNEHLAVIAKLPLQSLELDRCPKVDSEGLQHLEDHPKLESLRLKGLPQVDDRAFATFGTLAKLRALEVRGTQRVTANAIHLLRGELEIINGPIPSLPPKLQSLRLVDLDQLDARSAEAIASFTTLTELDLWGCDGIDDEAVENLIPLSRLRKLKIGGNVRGFISHRITLSSAALDSICFFGKLEELTFAAARVADSRLDRLARLPRLRRLDLSLSRNISGRGFDPMPELEELAMAQCETDDGSISAIVGNAPGLRRLDLSYGPGMLSSEGLRQLQGLSRLEELDLSRRNVDDEALAGLKGLGTLRCLDLRGNSKLGDLGLGHLKALPSLELLQISSSAFTVRGLKSYETARPGCRLDVE